MRKYLPFYIVILKGVLKEIFVKIIMNTVTTKRLEYIGLEFRDNRSVLFMLTLLKI